MTHALSALHDRLAPAEALFFTWLIRLSAAAVLVGCAWIDDAPPLELAAVIIAIYAAIRVVTEFGHLLAVAPFRNGALKAVFAAGAILLLGLSFVSVVIFVERLAELVAG